jgi:hypothetical protein
VIGGVLGHQVGGGRGQDIATAGGAVAALRSGPTSAEVARRSARRTCSAAPVPSAARVRNTGTWRTASAESSIVRNSRRLPARRSRSTTAVAPSDRRRQHRPRGQSRRHRPLGSSSRAPVPRIVFAGTGGDMRPCGPLFFAFDGRDRLPRARLARNRSPRRASRAAACPCAGTQFGAA